MRARLAMAVVLMAAMLVSVWQLHTLGYPAPDAPLPEIAWQFEPAAVEGRGAEPVSVTLPDHWGGDRRQLAAGRYVGRFEITPALATEEPWFLYLGGAGGDLSLTVNGVRLTPAARGGVNPSGAQPLLFRISPPIRQNESGPNELVIEIASGRVGGTYLGAAFVGPESALGPAYETRSFIKRTLPMILVVCSLLLGGASLVLWLRRRHERIYLWHASACAFVSAYILLSVLGGPLPQPWGDLLICVLALAFGLSCVLLLARFFDATPLPGLRETLVCSASATVIAIVSALVFDAQTVSGLVLPLLGMVVVVALGRHLLEFWRLAQRRPTPETFWLMVAACGIFICSLRDTLVLGGLVSPHDGLWGQYLLLAALLSFEALVLGRFQRALTEAELLNKELESRVAVREAQLARSFEQLRRVEHERSIAAERERLFRDMHDGMGGTLVAALARLSNEGVGDTPVAHALRSALNDLRLILASLDPEERSLRAALAGLRERLAASCADAGVELTFDLGALPYDLPVSPNQSLQILRIVQEASSNALRHAHARHLRVTAALASPSQETLELRVEDDGKGFAPELAARPGHHGLAILRRRARSLGGEIELSSANTGTRLRFHLPLKRGGTAAPSPDQAG